MKAEELQRAADRNDMNGFYSGLKEVWGTQTKQHIQSAIYFLGSVKHSKFLVWIMFILIILSLLLFIIIFIFDIEFY